MLVAFNMLPCRDTRTLNMIEKHLPSFCSAAENAALYSKMEGGPYCLLTMLKEDKQSLTDNALGAIEAACKAAESLSPAHPFRLVLLFMKTTFYNDVLEWPERAIALGKRALEEAGPELVWLDEESYKDSAEIVGLIKENLKLWKIGLKSKYPENTFKASLETAPKGTPPPPVVPLPHTAPVAPNNFTSPGDWGYELHEGLSLSEMRSRKKDAQIGFMG
ncbi:unnamed protein product [Urochloa decumbens]|uniref:14-3-3 domain-containing protein n=1 Tax=Urochloa decumbens TaxID=240449 RepID=A0ABC9GN93_9POAL